MESFILLLYFKKYIQLRPLLSSLSNQVCALSRGDDVYAFKSSAASSTKTLGERAHSDAHSFPALSLNDKENNRA